MRISPVCLTILLLSLVPCAAAQAQITNAAQPDSNQVFAVTSTAFTNGSTLPISMINNDTVNGSNVCSLNGAPGGNESPELSWTNVPKGTVSFVVILYDRSAAFTHWGMYNISGSATGLPENAGVTGSTYGSEIYNDFISLNMTAPVRRQAISLMPTTTSLRSMRSMKCSKSRGRRIFPRPTRPFTRH